MSLLYWTVRICLVLLWSYVAVGAWKAGKGKNRIPWRVLSALGLLLASIRATLWNWPLLELGRNLLEAADAYEDRIWHKVVFLVLVLILAVPVLLWYGKAAHREGWRLGVALGAALWMTGFVALATLSLDAILPEVLWQQPGRYGFEGFLALSASTAILVQRRKTA